MRKSQNLLGLVVLMAVLVIWQVGQARNVTPPPGDSNKPLPLSGYAWSSTIGWISFATNGFSGPSYGVMLLAPGSDGSRYLGPIGNQSAGYAWNPNIGWIKFDPNFATATDFPPNSDEHFGVRLDGTQFRGWARACAVFASNCSGDLAPDSARGGWDGWIKFAGTTTGGSAYSATVGTTANGIPAYFTPSGTDPSGPDYAPRFAWGGNTITGWIHFCNNFNSNQLDDPSKYCVTFGSLNASCQVLGTDADDNITVNNGDSVTWHGSALGGKSPYYLSWSGVVNADNGGGAIDGSDATDSLDASKTYSGLTGCPDFDRNFNNESADFQATDIHGLSASCTAAANVHCSATPINPSDGGPDLCQVGSPGCFGDISITSQPLTSPAISSATSFKNNAETSLITLTVGSIKSVNNNASILENNAVQCQMRLDDGIGHDPGVGAFSPCSGFTFEVPANRTAYFNLQILKPFAGLSTNSPYTITIGDANFESSEAQPDDPNSRSFLFHYSVGTTNPQ